MSNTSILLRESIRRIIREAAGSSKIDELVDRLIAINTEIAEREEWIHTDPESVPKVGMAIGYRRGDVHVTFAVSGLLEPGHVRLCKREGDSERIEEELDVDVPYGSISFGGSEEDPCLGAWNVNVTSETTPGWGPLLYDIAIEVATVRAGGLTADRRIVSGAARSLWDKYDTARDDVEKLQLDLSDDDLEEWDLGPDRRLTPGVVTDDCVQRSAVDDLSLDNWHKSPLSRVYRKPPTTMSRLESMGMLFRTTRT